MNKKIKVSVIVPVYNGMPFLKYTIDSILKQTYKNFELILINDGSNDSSESYIESLSDERIVYLHQKNIGLCASLNYAFSIAKGYYIVRNDQDDVSELDRIEKQVLVMEKSNYDCVFSYITKISTGKEWSNLDKTIANKGKFRDFLPWKDGCFVNSTMLIKRDIFELLGGYRKDYYPSDDWDLELRLHQKFKVGVIEEPLVKYRFHDTANTYKYWQLMQDTRRWSEDSYFRRESNEPELLFSHFLQKEKKNKLVFYNRRRKDYAKLCFRKAGGNFLLGNKLLLFSYLVLAGIFDPKTILLRLSKLIKNGFLK